MWGKEARTEARLRLGIGIRPFHRSWISALYNVLLLHFSQDICLAFALCGCKGSVLGKILLNIFALK